MSDQRINLAELQKDAEFVCGFIDGDSSQAGGYLEQFARASLALVEAVEAAHAEIEHADSCPLCRGSAPDCDDGLHAGADVQDALARFEWESRP